MKNQLLTSLIAFGFAALLGSIPAAAQTIQSASIPFAFQVGGTEYPDGNYAVEQLTALRVVKLTNIATGRTIIVNTPVLIGDSRHITAKLVFSQNGEGMRLSEVWFPGYPGMLASRSGKESSAKVAVGLK